MKILEKSSVICMLLLLGLLFITACSKSGSSNDPGDERLKPLSTSSLQGIWLQKSDANELRSTGKINSRCEELKKNPKTILNTYLVKTDGTVTMYDPNFPDRPELIFGTLDSLGKLTFAPDISNQLGAKTYMTVQRRQDITVWELREEGQENGIKSEYVQSSETEIRRYLAAQELCRK